MNNQNIVRISEKNIQILLQLKIQVYDIRNGAEFSWKDDVTIYSLCNYPLHILELQNSGAMLRACKVLL